MLAFHRACSHHPQKWKQRWRWFERWRPEGSIGCPNLLLTRWSCLCKQPLRQVKLLTWIAACVLLPHHCGERTLPIPDAACVRSAPLGHTGFITGLSQSLILPEDRGGMV